MSAAELEEPVAEGRPSCQLGLPATDLDSHRDEVHFGVYQAAELDYGLALGPVFKAFFLNRARRGRVWACAPGQQQGRVTGSFGQVAADIDADIDSGKAAPRHAATDRAGTGRAVRLLRVTIRRAITVLRDRGNVVTVHGRDTYTAEPSR